MTVYTISLSGPGLTLNSTRKRRDMAALAFERAAYAAIKSLAWLDTSQGHAAMRKARLARQPDAYGLSFAIGPYSATFQKHT